MKHVTVLGYGSMGRRHAMNAIALDYAVSVYDADIAKAATWEADHHAAKAAGRPFTYRSMFGNRGNEADDVWRWDADAVIIATPADQHADTFWRAADACPAVFVEKPVALSATEFLRGFGTVDGRLHACVPGAGNRPPTWQVGYNLRHHAGFRSVKDRMPRIGTPLAGRFTVSCDARTWPGSGYASPLLECSHEVDLALWLLGPSTLVGAAATADGHVWELLLSHATGAVSTIRIDDRSPVYRRGGEITGSDGAIRWRWDPTDSAEPWMFRTAFTPTDRKLPSATVARAVTPDDTYLAELQAFFMAAKAGRPGDPSVDDGLATLRILDIAAVSAEVTSWNRRTVVPAVQG